MKKFYKLGFVEKNSIDILMMGKKISLWIRSQKLIQFVLFLILIPSLSTLAQNRSNDKSLSTLFEPYESIEFLSVRKDVELNKDVFLKDYLQLLQLTPNSEMRFVRTQTNDVGISSTLYQQYLNGYKVKGAEMIINEKAGKIKYINGRYMTTMPVGLSATVTEKSGLEIAEKKVNSTDYLWKYPEAEAAYRRFKKDSFATYVPKGELMYIPNLALPFDKQAFRLVWRYAIHVNPQIESAEIFVDANSGEVVSKLPLTYECSGGTSTTLWNGPQTIYTQLNAGSYRTLGDCNSAQINTYNGNGNDNGVGATYYTDADNAWPNTALGQYIAQAHWGSKQTRNYYVAIHSREGYDDAGADFITYLNPGYTGNAYWTGSGTSFGGSSTGTNPYVTLDVCGHEHTHGMIDYTSNLTYSNESGALNESFADCIGEAVEEYTLGSADWIHRFEIGSGNRSFIDPNAKGQPDTYQGTNWYTGTGDNGGVHTNSGVQNFWFYLLSVGGSGTNDNGDAYNVSGITIDKARLIAYDCMIALSSGSQFANARSVSIQKAKDRYGDCSNEAEQTTRAWYAVGVGANWVNPIPLTITISSTATEVCKGGAVTLTASGASTYAWVPSGSTSNPATITPSSTTIYTVTGTNAEQCTGTKTFTVKVNSLPTVEPTVSDDELCPGQSTFISSGTNQTINSILTQLDGTNGSSGNAFDVHAYNSITITDFKMNIISGDSAEVWYKLGGYGNAIISSSAGWSKLGATVPITAAGAGNLTTIPTTANLTIGAGSTYGIIVVCNGANRYTNGTTVGSIAASNPDLYITEGHGGNGFNGAFNYPNSPRVFDGEIQYRTNYTSYSWAPAATLSSSTVSTPTATPTSSTIYTLTATDGNGCTGTGLAKVYVYPNPLVGVTSATPSTICSGGSSQLNNFPILSNSSQSLFTTLAGGNGNSANMFDIHAINNITITNVRMHIPSGDSAEVWYKTSPYGNANVTSNVGWTKLGNTVPITAAGAGALTLIPTSANLVIPAGSTYGIAIFCNGSNDYTNGTAAGTVAYSSPDLEITEGHGGSGFNGTFNFINSNRIFNGQIDYTVTNDPMNFSWSPSVSLSSSFAQNPVAIPRSTTNYTLTITDVHGCQDQTTQKIHVNPLSNLIASVSPTTVCPGDSAQLNVVNSLTEKDSLFTTLSTDNSNAGNAFNITTTKPISIKSFKMHLSSGVTQVEAWYKVGGYGNANFSGTAGWTKIGSTVNVTAVGLGSLTNVPLSAALAIPAGSTYGIMLVANGTVNYLNSINAVGSVYMSNGDFSISVGHGGTGIGAYSFVSSPRVWNGEVVYEVENSLAGFVWTPNTNMNNTTIVNPKVAPLSNTIYSVTTTDVNGCTATASIGVNVSPLPLLGTANATPATLCLGDNVNLSYTQPTGLSCFGAFQSGFAGTYAPVNWTQSLVNSNGTVVTSLVPAEITLTSSNGLVGSGQTNYSITVPCTGIVTFDWEYLTIDSGPQYDLPKYAINGGTAVVFPTFRGQNGDPKQQAGSVSIAMTAGQSLTIQAHSSDNLGGSASIKIKNFKAPYQTNAGQSVAWFNAATNGINLGNGNPQAHTPLTANTFTYYAQVTSSVTGCTNASRVATNAVLVDPVPNILVSTTQSTICEGSSTTLTGNNATTYLWEPGALSGSSINVSPSATTIYTVTGTNAQGCTKSTTITITVNPRPVIAGSAAPGIICPGAPVTLTGTTPNVTWNWQPGNLNGSPVVVNPVLQTTYTVTATSTAGCTKTQTFVILMHPTPAITTSVAPSSTFCAGGSAIITASSPTAIGYTWQPGGSTGANLLVTLANTYTVTATNSQGCSSTATQIITVNSLPTVGTTVSNSIICLGQSTSITGTGAVTYIWQPGTLTGTTINVSPSTTTTYTVTGTNANGCVSTSTTTITVNGVPTVTASPSLSTICSGSSTTLTANGASSYSWEPGAVAGNPIVVNPLTNTVYTVTGISANGCSSKTTVSITVNQSPNIIVTALPSAAVCTGDSVKLTASGGNTIVWSGGISNGIKFSPLTTTVYTVTATAANGCTSSSSRTIYVGTCAACNSNIVISTSPYSILLTESTTFIETNGTVIIDSGKYVKFDAAPSSYVKLQPGFSTTSGSVFIAQAFNGCTEGSPQIPNEEIKTLVNHEDESIMVYPNPTTGKVTIVHPTSLQELDLFDLSGKRMLHINTAGGTQTDIDVGNFANGIYLLYAQGYTRIKIIKK